MDDVVARHVGRPTAGRKVGVSVLVVLSALLMLFGVTAGWMKYQLLDTDNWVETSQQSLEDPAVRSALSSTLVDTVYDAADPQQRLLEALPSRFDPLASPVTSALRPAAYDATERALATSQVSDLWATVNRAAHERLMDVVEGDSEIVQSTGNEVTLDLRALVNSVAERLGVGPFEGNRIPPEVTTVSLPDSQNAARGIQGLRQLDRLGIWLGLIGVAALGIALALARGFRRSALSLWGASMVVAGFVLHANISIGRSLVPSELTDTPSWREALTSIYDIATEQLSLSANALILVGAVVLLATWLLGVSRAAVTSRRYAAPVLRDHALASWLGFIVVLYAMFTLTPALSSRSAPAALMLVVLAVLGFWALRRELVRSVPVPALVAAGSTTPWVGNGSAPHVVESADDELALEAIPPTLREHATPEEVERFVRVIDLRDRQVLSEAEFDAARAALVERLERRVGTRASAEATTADTPTEAG